MKDEGSAARRSSCGSSFILHPSSFDSSMVRPGLEVLIDDPRPLLGKRIGLVTNQSAVASDLQHAVRLLHAGRGWQLTALFGPEHGIWGEAQDMDHVGHSIDPMTGLTVW